MKEFDRLVEIFERLRAPGGCPWDAQQTHQSISRCAVEEAYELVDAIDGGDLDHMREELGDVLLQVLFHSTIAKDLGEFTITDVINDLADKLIYRHPHVFGGESVSSSSEVIRNWERLKKKEEGKSGRESILDGIPESLPALLHARKIQSAASRVGFDWQDAGGAAGKVKEEADELLEALARGDAEEIIGEIGDLLFSIVNLARFAGVDPESALRRTNRKFRKRFSMIEAEAKKRGVALEEMSLQEMDELWEKAKNEPDS
ncbi:MAG TPA: nucleoside triphosphate pyrophosphohydrolase [Deltaproteobacteria bacterium]|jgi:tetrapyrrole methylase family protein/MazG family protein|nr:nucleoside triphosphate pyrophosphohydrolase [Deltaproteobacteria bacterium]HOE72569.1 nucleoside triphosphate pyrophosphohydrolase [Deltaproteobacteria bacterium]HON62481.1 nucleoside triphosphate pyrophosphohydrolase [Deltaproteobacteria bacterium]HOS28452.1 nucleoside triphosphate pyrophosphohydrolase [Deltaproteobacteria bacterium]HPL87261.1 nucleoside triphosphate pyrophosphohydrolase [Deltaproteobacteria bacterium]